MPELPEVETIRLQLLPVAQGREIETVRVHNLVQLQNCSVREFRKALQGRRIKDISRRGKYLIFHCAPAFAVFHLGMSGIFLRSRRDSRFPQHIHVDIKLKGDGHLYFQDARKFGKIWLFDQPPQLPQLGIDPISDRLTAADFQHMLQGSQTNIKLFLMDQSRIAGIGNIYASEMLHRAKISPLRRAGELNPVEVKTLHRALKKILSSAIENFGTTYSAYRTVNGSTGRNQNFLKVYQREALPCLTCGESIRKVIQGSRSTFYCPRCQQ